MCDRYHSATFIRKSQPRVGGYDDDKTVKVQKHTLAANVSANTWKKLMISVDLGIPRSTNQ
jgi:hypothetical protein